MRRLAMLAGWLAVAAMSAVAAIRLSRSDAHPALVATQGVASWLLLPAYPVAAVAAAQRRTVLASAAVVLAAGQAGLAAAEAGWGRARPAPPGTATVRLLTANLLAVNRRLPAAAAALSAVRPDLVLLQEITPEVLAGLRSAGLLDRYPHQVLDPLPGYHGSAILSRLPMLAGRAVGAGGYPAVYADVETAAGRLRVVNVHAPAPVSRERIALWRAQLASLPALRPPGGRPFVLAGDFNATLAHRPFAGLMATGLRDAYRDAGRGLGATWPCRRPPVPPLMRLDHVLVSDAIAVVRVDAGRTPGSDHRHLLAELAVPRESPGRWASRP